MEENLKQLKYIIQLLRPKHYLKNGLIFVPMFFDLRIFNVTTFFRGLYGFFAFSMCSSVVYIINDLNDIESDRNHAKKRYRPLAAGTVSIRRAKVLLILLFAILVCLNIALKSCGGVLYLALYFVLNVAYSRKLKNLPIIDVVVLASGFLIRLLYGAVITNTDVSFWLCMTVTSFSFYAGLGKRRNELVGGGTNAGKIRGVLTEYNSNFLDRNMYMCLGLAITFYALWSGAAETVKKFGSDYQIWTVPIVIIIAMRYSLDIETRESADPIEIILGDKWLISMAVLYVLILFGILYF